MGAVFLHYNSANSTLQSLLLLTSVIFTLDAFLPHISRERSRQCVAAVEMLCSLLFEMPVQCFHMEASYHKPVIEYDPGFYPGTYRS